ncbi:MAG: ComEC/Rec2 family competence protein [bacterium]|nr:ComEC/Rec2 family competence protein [bacterium]
MSVSKGLFLFGIGWIGGIALHSFVPVEPRGILALLFAGIFALAIFRRRGLGIALMLFACCLGVLYHSASLENEAEHANSYSPFFNKEVIVKGRIAEEPEERREVGRIQMQAQGFEGQILLFLEVDHGFSYGDIIEARGILEEAPVFEDFDYRAFLRKDGVFATMRNPEVKLVERQAYRNLGEALYGKLLSWKEGRREDLYRTFSPLEGAVLGATLLADKRMWTEAFEAKLNGTGLTHVTAISGQHVAIFISLLTPFFLWLGLWKQQAYMITLGLVGIFILLTGGDAAALRGGFMGSLASLGVIWGRQSQSMRLLVLAGSVMLLFNPFLLARDAGFQLSFLAVLGILLFSLRLQEFLRFLPKDFGIREAGSMTIAAQVFTTPLLIFIFGRVSLLSPITNILIGPVVPMLLSAGLLFLCFSWIPFSILLAAPLHMMLSYFLFIVDSFSALPFGVLESIQ